MERPELENERRRRPPKDKEKVVQCAAKRMLALVPATKPPAPPANHVQLAALAVDLNVRMRSADMPAAMQERVIRHSRVLLDTNADNKRFNPTHLAMCLKKEFDALYGPAWHCIVGKSFGSFVTHASGGFVYFSIDKLSFLLFKTEVRPVVATKKPPLLLKYKS
ncbi:hypothetical protein CICLE_v10006088mg [Citrus x clementina]|uniref:Dynein light chain n=1 Tax=Citrus clementina TaxID=85681 RepID=V4RL39_CITCL|nr:uncharacterized protein LOC18031417 [Citrus x clementina]ESR34893.1 hypothetical protein CICLE_v10006088mg [Citrus x clementina]